MFSRDDRCNERHDHPIEMKQGISKELEETFKSFNHPHGHSISEISKLLQYNKAKHNYSDEWVETWMEACDSSMQWYCVTCYISHPSLQTANRYTGRFIDGNEANDECRVCSTPREAQVPIQTRNPDMHPGAFCLAQNVFCQNK